MAVRITVSIPDALAERMEPFKDLISPSEIMQQALTDRLDQLEAQASAANDADRLKACIASFTQSREPRYIRAARQLLDSLLSQEQTVHKLLSFYPELHAVANGESDLQTISDLIDEFADEEELKTWDQKELFIKEFSEMAIDRLSGVIDEETEAALM